MLAVLKREWSAYFATPLGIVFIMVFLLTHAIASFYLGDYFHTNQADLQLFFSFHPWVYLFFLPAISMRLWAEERRNGSIELLLSLPLSLPAVVLGKYLAALAFTGFALFCTFPIWLSVNYLGAPDNGTIFAAYCGSLLMAAGFLSIGMCFSALARNQITAFVLSVVACLIITLSGAPLVLDFLRDIAPQYILETLASFSMLVHFKNFTNGVIDARALIFFASLIFTFLCASAILIDAKRGDL